MQHSGVSFLAADGGQNPDAQQVLDAALETLQNPITYDRRTKDLTIIHRGVLYNTTCRLLRVGRMCLQLLPGKQMHTLDMTRSIHASVNGPNPTLLDDASKGKLRNEEMEQVLMSAGFSFEALARNPTKEGKQVLFDLWYNAARLDALGDDPETIEGGVERIAKLNSMLDELE